MASQMSSATLGTSMPLVGLAAPRALNSPLPQNSRNTLTPPGSIRVLVVESFLLLKPVMIGIERDPACFDWMHLIPCLNFSEARDCFRQEAESIHAILSGAKIDGRSAISFYRDVRAIKPNIPFAFHSPDLTPLPVPSEVSSIIDVDPLSIFCGRQELRAAFRWFQSALVLLNHCDELKVNLRRFFRTR